MKGSSNQLLPATDVDYLISLGYDPELCKDALRICDGNIQAATHILSKGVITTNDKSWRNETSADWVSRGSQPMPINHENRALWKSPIYISVTTYSRNEFGTIIYDIRVVMKDGRKWTVRRSYDDFYVLRISLPLRVCGRYTVNFPRPFFLGLFKQRIERSDIEKRAQELGDWIRTIVLDESCMASPDVIKQLYKFVELDSHGGPNPAAASIPTDASILNDLKASKLANKTSSSSVAALHSPLLDASAVGKMTAEEAFRKRTLIKGLPTMHSSKFPLTLLECLQNLPFKVDVQQLAYKQPPPVPQNVLDNTNASTAEAASAIGMNFDLRQMDKDIARDKLLIQGRRIVGGSISLKAVVALCEKSILDVMTEQGIVLLDTIDAGPNTSLLAQYLSTENQKAETETVVEPSHRPSVHNANNRMSFSRNSSVELLALSSLQLISRTESAFLSHSSLYEIIDTVTGALDTVIENPARLDDFDAVSERTSTSSGQLLIVPESKLASPMSLSYYLQEQSPGQQWCVTCEGETSTVFRALDPETLKPLIQLRVAYVNTLFGMPIVDARLQCNDSGGGGGSEDSTPRGITGFKIKKGKAYIVLSRDTTSTDRDW